MRLRSKDGFTLVELMIVIGIIGVLTTVAVPSFKLYKYKAQQGEIYEMIDGIYRGVAAYYYAEHHTQGLSGTSLSYCLPIHPVHWIYAMVPSWVIPTGEKRTYNFEANPLYQAINFSVETPFYGTYISHATIPALTQSGGTYCGLADMSTNAAYWIRGWTDWDQDGTVNTIHLWAYIADEQIRRGKREQTYYLPE